MVKNKNNIHSSESTLYMRYAVPEVSRKPVYEFFKRLFDIFASALLIIICLPLFIVIGAAIKLSDGGNILYINNRVGKGGREYKFYKFRSMCINADNIYDDIKKQTETGGPIFKMKDDPRVTKVGRFLRRTSLDELPQLFNILFGDMSFVGPRPPLPREVDEYDESAMIRLSVKGGLTCYWQVMGRSSIDFDGMVELDKRYIKERSILTDIKLLFMTIPSVIKGDGAY